jgi:hypothetical protein
MSQCPTKSSTKQNLLIAWPCQWLALVAAGASLYRQFTIPTYTFDPKTGALISKLISPKPQANGNFGISVATLGDIVVVGAPMEASAGPQNAGSAYVFNGLTGALIALMASPPPQMNGLFGWSCSLSQKDLIAIGAPHETTAGTQWAVRAYTFSPGPSRELRTDLGHRLTEL